MPVPLRAGPGEGVALVHDFLVSLRGADRVFLDMCEMWPHADIYTPVYDEEGTKGRFSHRPVHTSFLQRLEPTASDFRRLLPLYPAAIESFDLSGYDLIVSSSSAWAHAAAGGPQTVHVSYCHNPFRYVWNELDRTLEDRPEPFSRAALRVLFDRWRRWDRAAAQRVDAYVTNSALTRERIARYLHRDATIVPPPVRTSRFSPGPDGDHYLVVSELIAHKRIDVIVRAFNELELPLVVVGDGPDAEHLRRLAGPTITFAGRAPDEEVERLVGSCRALVVAAIEEFGIAAVEAQAAGRPVIAAAGGGLLDIVREGETGCFWHGGPDELAEAVRRFDDRAVDPDDCIDNAARFDSELFKERLAAEVDRVVTASRGEGRLAPVATGRSRRRFARLGRLSRLGVTVPARPELLADRRNGRFRREAAEADESISVPETA